MEEEEEEEDEEEENRPTDQRHTPTHQQTHAQTHRRTHRRILVQQHSERIARSVCLQIHIIIHRDNNIISHTKALSNAAQSRRNQTKLAPTAKQQHPLRSSTKSTRRPAATRLQQPTRQVSHLTHRLSLTQPNTIAVPHSRTHSLSPSFSSYSFSFLLHKHATFFPQPSASGRLKQRSGNQKRTQTTTSHQATTSKKSSSRQTTTTTAHLPPIKIIHGSTT